MVELEVASTLELRPGGGVPRARTEYVPGHARHVRRANLPGFLPCAYPSECLLGRAWARPRGDLRERHVERVLPDRAAPQFFYRLRDFLPCADGNGCGRGADQYSDGVAAPRAAAAGGGPSRSNTGADEAKGRLELRDSIGAAGNRRGDGVCGGNSFAQQRRMGGSHPSGDLLLAKSAISCG